MGHSITYWIAVGPRAGQKVFTLQTVPAQGEGEGHNGDWLAGFRCTPGSISMLALATSAAHRWP